MGLGGVAIAVPPYVIHPKTAVLGRAGGGEGLLSTLVHLYYFFNSLPEKVPYDFPETSPCL